MRVTIELRTDRREQLLDITARVRDAVRESGLRAGLVNIYAQGATAAIMIQENWDASVPTDVVNLLHQLMPPGVWLHDAQDNIGDEIDDEGHDEEDEADREERVVVGRVIGDLAELDGDRGGHGPDGIEEARRKGARISRGHENGHGFADGPSHTQHDRGDDSR